jgi:transcriptional regulator with GAF, ATPase, and Fis domain
MVKRALHIHSLHQRIQASHLPEQNFHGLTGVSKSMQEIYRFIERVALSDISILICGESGTGKELVAQAIHENSPRKDNPFFVVNCGAIPDTLLESELFGHEKGAFTGAHAQKKGKFELATTGTLFLDEIGDWAPPIIVSKSFRSRSRRYVRDEKIFYHWPITSYRDIVVSTENYHSTFLRKLNTSSYRILGPVTYGNWRI